MSVQEASRDQDKLKLLYILSPSYSGSTLLTFLLAQHPSIATIGELKATAMGDIKDYICSCGTPILECDFWSAVVKEAKQRGLDFDLSSFGTSFRSSSQWKDKILESQVRGQSYEMIRDLSIKSVPGLSKEFHQILDQNEALVDICMKLQGGSVFIDGSKDPHRLKYLIQSNRWDVYVIDMVRDGRAQANSARAKVLENLNYEEASAEWKYTISQMEQVRKYIPDNRHLSFHYEELCESPNDVINNIWDFIGLDEIDQDWGNVDLEGGNHHILGNDNMRKSKAVKIKLDEKWRSQVTKQELDAFEEIAGDTNRRLGYK